MPAGRIPRLERGPCREIVGEPPEPVLDLGAHGEDGMDAVGPVGQGLVLLAPNAHTPVERTSRAGGYVSSDSMTPACHHGSGSAGGGRTSASIASTTDGGCSGVTSTSMPARLPTRRS